jgi:hypothetical protein
MVTAMLLALGINLELMLFRGIVALIFGVSEDSGERMPVIGIAGQLLGVEDQPNS